MAEFLLRTCTECGEEKPLKAFDKTGKYYRRQCRECRKEVEKKTQRKLALKTYCWKLVYAPDLGPTRSRFTKSAVYKTLAMGNWLPGMIFENGGKRYEVVGSGSKQKLEAR